MREECAAECRRDGMLHLLRALVIAAVAFAVCAAEACDGDGSFDVCAGALGGAAGAGGRFAGAVDGADDFCEAHFEVGGAVCCCLGGAGRTLVRVGEREGGESTFGRGGGGVRSSGGHLLVWRILSTWSRVLTRSYELSCLPPQCICYVFLAETGEAEKSEMEDLQLGYTVA